ncbi:heterokaryon incompatibility protein HET-6-like protein [Colletotrichum truncatum]|uniref:Heterokaryon incompatibility protein HET-6-like protein n=1 Tax=Colletotrichum truncatum TaxID=5467 RepID=A0ACC3YY85_COLTU|nr:heterokaryon incompatibility protein HET-6-like protein [Colletotrichum truncatum]KAF6782101.1 heterokaryon incompatibility protein HET-6-like protein [Colletotrichum truncatum]
MSQWHADTCRNPRVIVGDAGVPSCEHCGRSAQEILNAFRADKETLPLPPVPPDEPPGQLNLWWPPSVTYTSASGSGNERETDSESLEAETLTEETLSKPLENQVPCQTNLIYEKALASDEIRLARLDSTRTASHLQPVHISFEIFNDKRHPDYETVSYTWGGEENNYTQSHPIYVGDYWDIIYTTRNCWAMLRYLRPHRDTRLIWVDVVCINQSDMQERSRQVSKMGQIYTRCNQVVLWLGDDVVSDDYESLPSRHPLHEIDLASSQSRVPMASQETSFEQRSAFTVLEKLFLRRYFTRVWVIQELVLSPRILVPFEDKVFWADPFTSARIEGALNKAKTEKKWSWNNTAAPWLRLMAQGLSHGQSWSNVMTLTSKSRSSDSRDGLYGILGLFPEGPDGMRLVPDYSISYQHMMMGAMAHELINGGNTGFLFAARGISPPRKGISTLPSWLPPWDNWNEAERKLLRSPLPVSHQGKAIDEKKIVLLSEEQAEFSGENFGYFRFGPVSPGCDRKHWNDHATIDRNTGSLSLCAIKLVTIRSAFRKDSAKYLPQPSYKAKLKGIGSVYVTSEHDLTSVAKEGDEIFSLYPAFTKGNEEPECSVYLLLRRISQQQFKLVAGLSYLYFSCGNLEVFRELPFQGVRESLSQSISVLKQVWNLPLHTFDEGLKSERSFGRIIEKAFPGNDGVPFHFIVPIILGYEGFGKLHQNPVARKLQPRVVNDYLELTFGSDDWTTFKSTYSRKKPLYYPHRPNTGCLYWEQETLKIKPQDEAASSGQQEEFKSGVKVRLLLEHVNKLFRMIDDHLRISGIWESINVTNPRGSWEELLQADALFGDDIGTVEVRGEYAEMFGICGLSGVESRIEIL